MNFCRHTNRLSINSRGLTHVKASVDTPQTFETGSQSSLTYTSPESLCQRLDQILDPNVMLRPQPFNIHSKQNFTSILYRNNKSKAEEMHILRYQMLDIIHWQSTLDTVSFAALYLQSSAIQFYCCVSAHKHLRIEKIFPKIYYDVGMYDCRNDNNSSVKAGQQQSRLLRLLTDALTHNLK